MSHFTQMVGAHGAELRVGRGRARGRDRADPRPRPPRTGTIGNFWVDLVRAPLRILLPIAFVFAIVIMSQGVIQNTHGFTKAHTVEGTTQQIPGGPVASQEAIKELGNNGGGFFNVNSAHPFENPNGVTELLRDLPDPRHPVLAGVDLRADGEGPASRVTPCSRSCS